MPFALALWLVVCPLCSQFETKLTPATAAAFDAYMKVAESELQERWSGRAPFISAEVSSTDGKKLVIHPASSPNPKDVEDGLIHDWVGAVYLPNTTIDKVLAVLQDFDRHSKIYPEIVRSRLLKREGNEITGYWRLERKQQFVPAVFDVVQEAHYKQVASGRWICRAYSKEIREVQDAGSAHEKDYPAGEGLGLLWRLNAFWSLQASGDGVLAECRTISLSRSIPSGMGWMIRPFIQNVPRESLTSTLRNTKEVLR